MVPTIGRKNIFNYAQKSFFSNLPSGLSARYDTTSSSPRLSKKNENSVIFLFFWWRFGEDFSCCNEPSVYGKIRMISLFTDWYRNILSVFIISTGKIENQNNRSNKERWTVLPICDFSFNHGSEKKAPIYPVDEGLFQWRIDRIHSADGPRWWRFHQNSLSFHLGWFCYLIRNIKVPALDQTTFSFGSIEGFWRARHNRVQCRKHVLWISFAASRTLQRLIVSSWLLRYPWREQLSLSNRRISFGIGLGKVGSTSEAIVFLRLQFRIILSQHNSVYLLLSFSVGGAVVYQSVSVLSFR